MAKRRIKPELNLQPELPQVLSEDFNLFYKPEAEPEIAGLKEFSNDYQIVLPAHPRLKKYINDNDVEHENIFILNPLSYIDFLGLVSSSDLVLTDSGGLQEETTHLNVKCLTLRNETERPITVTEGTNKVIGIETEKIIYEINNTIQSKLSKGTEIKFWDGKTSERIYKELYEQI